MKAKKPILYVGGGVVFSQASKELLELAEMTQIPVDMTLMGLGAFPGEHPQSMGMMGMHGTYCANMAVHYSDLVIAVGARFDDRVTGKVSEFCPLCQSHSHRYRSDVDPEKYPCRYSHRGRLQGGLAGAESNSPATVNGDQKTCASLGGIKSANGSRRIRWPISRSPKGRSSRNMSSSGCMN